MLSNQITLLIINIIVLIVTILELKADRTLVVLTCKNDIKLVIIANVSLLIFIVLFAIFSKEFFNIYKWDSLKILKTLNNILIIIMFSNTVVMISNLIKNYKYNKKLKRFLWFLKYVCYSFISVSYGFIYNTVVRGF